VHIVPLGQNLVLNSITTDFGDVLVAEGELDLSSAPLLSEAFDRSDSGNLFVDLRGVNFMDSAGLAVLVREKNRCDGIGKLMTLVIENGPVLRLIELVSLRDHFAISPTLTY
jgi:anti-anti-sigma factor